MNIDKEDARYLLSLARDELDRLERQRKTIRGSRYYGRVTKRGMDKLYAASIDETTKVVIRVESALSKGT